MQKYVYHNSNADFKEFSLDYFGGTDAGSYCKGIYFSGKPDKRYGKKQYKAYINMQNPLRREDDPQRFNVNFRDLANMKTKREEITKRLIEDGYDGVIVQDSQYIVFDPSQIKIVSVTDV